MSADARRRVEIDALKVAGIVTIVLIHAMRSPWDTSVSAVEVWIGHATRFGVPAFLAASGYLYATRKPIPIATTRGRLRRILLPYLVASLAAQVFRFWRDMPPDTGAIWKDLLLAASFGPYYYVLVIALLVLATPLFARIPVRALVPVTLAFGAAQWVVDAAPFGHPALIWHLRNPLLWWAYFLAGWSVRLHRESLSRWVRARGSALSGACVGAALCLTAASALEGSAPRLFVRSAAWLDVYAILGAIALLSRHLRRSPAWLRRVSDATYAIYLFHLFFLLPVQELVPPPLGRVSLLAIGLPWLAGIAGSLALVVAARAVLGSRSRDWVGA